MRECSIYTIKVPDYSRRGRSLTFYAWRQGSKEKAIVLGFAAHTGCKEPESVCKEREKIEMANRAVVVKSTIITDNKGKCFNEMWNCQAVLVAMWRKLAAINFLRLPRKNPFLGKRPEHIDVIDWEERFKKFKEWERAYKKGAK
jgi:hypothetical protein